MDLINTYDVTVINVIGNTTNKYTGKKMLRASGGWVLDGSVSTPV